MSSSSVVIRLTASAVLGVACLAGCGDDTPPAAGTSTQAGGAAASVYEWQYPAAQPAGDWHWNLPPHMPPPRVPADNPMSVAKVALGRHLFHDQRLSRDGSLSCASCHQQARAFADAQARPAGITGERHPRNAMGLGNVAYHATQTWANPALLTLERQIPNPVFGTEPVEMGVDEGSVAKVLARLREATDVDYRGLFRAAFPEVVGDPIDWDHVFKAISAFERTLISADSRYDRFLQGKASLSAQERNGLALFGSAGCSQCHQQPNFTDQFVSVRTDRLTVRYHNVGLYDLDGRGAYPAQNTGAEEITGNPADMGAFRVPSLRNVAVTAPYMHDGSVATLEEAVLIMAAGGRVVTSGPYAGDGRKNPHKSPLLRDQGLSDEALADLVAFLHTLTDERFLTDPALADPFAGRQTQLRRADASRPRPLSGMALTKGDEDP